MQLNAMRARERVAAALSFVRCRSTRHAHRRGIAPAHAEATLLLAGVALVVVYGWAHADAAVGGAIDMKHFESAAPDTSLWSSSRLRAYRSSTASPSQHEVLGMLRIPQLNLRAPLYPDTHWIHLNRGVGLIPAMADPGRAGNLGIAGHRDGFFRALKDIKIGMGIEVLTRERLYRYRVTDIAVVDKTDTGLLQPTRSATISLVTCYPFYYVGSAPQRYVVRGELTSHRPLQPSLRHSTPRRKA